MILYLHASNDASALTRATTSTYVSYFSDVMLYIMSVPSGLVPGGIHMYVYLSRSFETTILVSYRFMGSESFCVTVVYYISPQKVSE